MNISIPEDNNIGIQSHEIIPVKPQDLTNSQTAHALQSDNHSSSQLPKHISHNETLTAMTIDAKEHILDIYDKSCIYCKAACSE